MICDRLPVVAMTLIVEERQQIEDILRLAMIRNDLRPSSSCGYDFNRRRKRTNQRHSTINQRLSTINKV